MDPFEFRKDGQLLARLSGASELGPFTAFEKMQVTAEGRRRGYFDLACGELVHTPQSKMQQHVRVQLPLRKGMLFRILLGQRKAGAKKKSTTQNNLICLSYVESHSAYRAEINNPLGLYEWRRKKVLADPEADFLSGPFFERPLKESKFCWVLTSALCTSPDGWIQRMNPMRMMILMATFPQTVAYTPSTCCDQIGMKETSFKTTPSAAYWEMVTPSLIWQNVPSPATRFRPALKLRWARQSAPWWRHHTTAASAKRGRLQPLPLSPLPSPAAVPLLAQCRVVPHQRAVPPVRCPRAVPRPQSPRLYLMLRRAKKNGERRMRRQMRKKMLTLWMMPFPHHPRYRHRHRQISGAAGVPSCKRTSPFGRTFV
jgi:hypothetical protein